jgi:hypothetical protein
MRKLILAAVMATAASPIALPAPAAAQGPNEVRARQDCRYYDQSRRECRREIARARNRDWRAYRRYDWNSYEPGYNAYYADDYYRDGRYYGERRLSYNDRIYRGRDGRYYCRRSDGTTGLIIGAGVGALIGNSLDNGRSGLLGTLLGAAAGGAVGASIDRNDVRCR